MRFLLKKAWSVFVLCAGVCAISAQAQIMTLPTLQSRYADKLAGIDAEIQKKKSVAAQEYGSDLSVALKTVRQAGDFDGYVLIEGKTGVWIGFYKPVNAWKWVNLEKTGYTNWGSAKPCITKRSPRMAMRRSKVICASGTSR